MSSQPTSGKQVNRSADESLMESFNMQPDNLHNSQMPGGIGPMSAASQSAANSASGDAAVALRKEALTDIAQQLRGLSDRIVYFLDAQVQRLDRAMLACRALQNEGEAARRLVAQESQQREQWERKRQAELARLREASTQLAAGWQQLEDQRRAMMMQASHQGNHPVTNSLNTPGANNTRSYRPSGNHGWDVTLPSHSDVDDRMGNAARPAAVTQAALDDIQALQAEIARHNKALLQRTK